MFTNRTFPFPDKTSDDDDGDGDIESQTTQLLRNEKEYSNIPVYINTKTPPASKQPIKRLIAWCLIS